MPPYESKAEGERKLTLISGGNIRGIEYNSVSQASQYSGWDTLVCTHIPSQESLVQAYQKRQLQKHFWNIQQNHGRDNMLGLVWPARQAASTHFPTMLKTHKPLKQIYTHGYGHKHLRGVGGALVKNLFQEQTKNNLIDGAESHDPYLECINSSEEKVLDCCKFCSSLIRLFPSVIYI